MSSSNDDGLLDGLDISLDDLAVDLDAPMAADPLASVEYTGDAEADSRAETSALLSAFKARAQAEEKRFELATDSEYWVAVCFQTREQKEAFLAALDLLRHGDKYLDGYKVAERVGVTLPPADVPYNTGVRQDRKLLPLTELPAD